MKIERVVRFVRTLNGVSGENSVGGPRLAVVSLPRVKFIEGTPEGEKYFLTTEISAAAVANLTNVPIEKIGYYLSRKGRP